MAKVATRVAYCDALKELMVENKNVVVLDADLAGSTKSGEAKKVDPSRHFDMGIAEGNMMSVQDIVDILAKDVLGVVPDDESIVISTNKGEP